MQAGSTLNLRSQRLYWSHQTAHDGTTKLPVLHEGESPETPRLWVPQGVGRGENHANLAKYQKDMTVQWDAVEVPELPIIGLAAVSLRRELGVTRSGLRCSSKSDGSGPCPSAVQHAGSDGF